MLTLSPGRVDICRAIPDKVVMYIGQGCDVHRKGVLCTGFG
jgi:hypothetical protein